MTPPTGHLLARPGVICNLGAGLSEIGTRLLQGDASHLAAQAGWLASRETAVGAVTHALPPFPAGVPPQLRSRNNQLLLASARQIEDSLRTAVDRYGPSRVGVVLGTSTSGVNDNAPAFTELAATGAWPEDYDYRRQSINAPAEFLSHWLSCCGPGYTLSTACTSSARALLSARRLLDLDLCDAVICGGVDTLCRLTLNGFASLEAISSTPCLPFSANRQGINIGEACALFLMTRDDSALDGVRLLGGAGSSDAWHMSAPEPTGAGARQVMHKAVTDAGIAPEAIAWVNLHGTGTALNDAMESHAMHAFFPAGVPCASTKGMTGHALGAAGALEAALCWFTLSSENAGAILPPHVWDGQPDPALPRLHFSAKGQTLAPGVPRIAMSNSFAFGGNNTSLIFEGRP
ncbi:3-oxoacyl-[ACP] synthase FabV like [plant metagenome]|uniref:3-oxoacyl-[ACP] synthase FabV like n=1 Tax=plant metagenome TaxID=1297885 RepID=A0A484U7Y1_9ZZZZ